MNRSKTFRLNEWHIKMLEEMSNKYEITQTDVITALLELAWNHTCNKELKLWDEADEYVKKLLENWYEIKR